VKILVSVKPGPDAELWRERVDHSMDHAGVGGAADLRTMGRKILSDAPTQRIAELLWCSRNGLLVKDLQALSGQAVDSIIDELEPLVIRHDDRVILKSATARELAASGSLADHGARQKLQLTLAEYFARQGGTPSALLNLWHLAQAGHSELLLKSLLAEELLAACREPLMRLEVLTFWKRLGDTQFLVDELAKIFATHAAQADVLMGVIGLVETASGQAVPRDWLQAGLTAALASGNDDLQATLLERLGTHPESAEEEKLKLLLQALSLREQSPGAGTLTCESVRHNVAYRHEEMDDLNGAADNYRASVAAIERFEGENSKRLIPWLNNLTAVHKARGEMKEAAALTSRVLKLARTQLGALHPAVASACDQLGSIQYQAGNYDEAEPLFRDALDIASQTFGPEHSATAACMNNLAALLDARQQFKEAETLYRKALAIRHGLHGEHHSDTASTLHNLATVLEAAGKTDEAEQLFRRALDAWDKVSGQESPAFATTLLSLADLLRDRERWGDAEALYRSDIEIWRSLVGPEHPHTLSALSGLARLYADGGKPELAEPLLIHVIDTSERVVGKTDPLYMEAVGVLGALLRQVNRLDEARQLLHQALAAHDNTLAMISAPVQKMRRLLDSLGSQSQQLH
jgi:tetratricopeptide (TPR) repeat protein